MSQSASCKSGNCIFTWSFTSRICLDVLTAVIPVIPYNRRQVISRHGRKESLTGLVRVVRRNVAEIERKRQRDELLRREGQAIDISGADVHVCLQIVDIGLEVMNVDWQIA